jgi:hypothetical protein
MITSFMQTDFSRYIPNLGNEGLSFKPQLFGLILSGDEALVLG